MPHQNTDSDKATAQNAATDPRVPTDREDVERRLDPEPRAYAAHDVRDSTLAAPAAGEIGDYADEGEPIDGEEFPGGQQGRTHSNREAHADHQSHGPKTLAANRAMSGSGSPDQGTE